MSGDNNGIPALRKLGFAILAIAVGPPLFQFFVIISWGAIAIPLLVLVLISPWLLVDYVVWLCHDPDRNSSDSAHASNHEPKA